MIVISDTSPITNLAAIGQLDLLRELFGRVLIAESVIRELRQGTGHPGLEVTQYDWVEIRSAADRAQVEEFERTLDEGEAETIALAIEVHADWTLIDERLGRAIAEQHGLKVIGVLGVLVRAKRTGLISAIKPLVEQLEHNGFRMDASLVSRILEQVNE